MAASPVRFPNLFDSDAQIVFCLRRQRFDKTSLKPYLDPILADLVLDSTPSRYVVSVLQLVQRSEKEA